jgi:hypothetical protein
MEMRLSRDKELREYNDLLRVREEGKWLKNREELEWESRVERKVKI